MKTDWFSVFKISPSWNEKCWKLLHINPSDKSTISICTVPYVKPNNAWISNCVRISFGLFVFRVVPGKNEKSEKSEAVFARWYLADFYSIHFSAGQKITKRGTYTSELMFDSYPVQLMASFPSHVAYEKNNRI